WMGSPCGSMHFGLPIFANVGPSMIPPRAADRIPGASKIDEIVAGTETPGSARMNAPAARPVAPGAHHRQRGVALDRPLDQRTIPAAPHDQRNHPAAITTPSLH